MRKLALLLVVCALALCAKDKPAKAKGQGHGKAQSKVHAQVGYYEFLPAHRTVVVDWYHAAPGGLPPGLAKKGDLPPGLMKQLRRKGHLPPGLEKKLVAFPPVLIERLPPVPYGCERVFAANIAIIWNPRTRVVMDFFAID